MNLADFFNYQSPYRTGIFRDLTALEQYLPIVIIITIAVLLFKYSYLFKKNELLDKKFRIIVAVVFTIIYLSHYIFRFVNYGFDTIVLPFQLCSISMFLAIILLLSKNKTIFNFVLFTGVLGGLISLFFPVIGYDSNYYRYYQFEIAHGLLILTPIYFMAVHNYLPSKKGTIYSFLILQAIAVFMVVFNYIQGTDFMFVFIDKNKIDKFPVIAKFGGIPLYLLWMELVGIAAFFIEYQVVNFFYKYFRIEEEII